MSFRARLALLFAGTITVLVVVTCTATYLVVRSNLRSDARADAARLARNAATAEPDELTLDRIAGPDARVWLTSGSGAIVARNHAAGPGQRTLAGVEHALSAAGGDATSAKAPRPGGGYAIVVLANSTLTTSLSTLLSTLVAVGAAMVLAAAVAGALLARRALQPVDRMRRQADAIPGDQLDRRIDEGRPDELGRLAAAFNRLLARAQAATEQQHRFVADASHELRTPLTAVQGHARIVARAADRGDLAQARESAQILADTGDRMARTMAELLSLAEADDGGHDLAPVRLDDVTAGACDDMRAAYPLRTVETQLDEVTVAADAGRLGEVVRILVDNALKYSPAGTPVEVAVRAREAVGLLTVRDHGPGLSADDAEHAFDRFYRGGASHGTNGSGLGLAIAQAEIRRHGGRIELSQAPGGGTLATVELPAARASGPPEER